MWYTILKRILKNAFKNIFRNKILSLATLFVIVLTMFSFLAMIITSLITDTITFAINKQADILIEIKDGAKKEDINEFISDIKNQPNVDNVIYMSKEEVFKKFTEKFMDIKDFWDENNLSNPLPAMVKIEISNPKYRKAIIDFILSDKYENIINKDFFVSDIESYKSKQIIKITEASKSFITAFTVLFLILSMLIIFNTIRINIFARKEELNIMRLIGAKYFYMKSPFIVEGIIYGILGSIISIILAIFVISFISPIVSNYTVGYYIGFNYSFYKYIFNTSETTLLKFFISNLFNLILFLSSIGAIIGAISAYIATYTYNKI